MDDENEIAIVGVGCRFPGADNLDEFWRVLVNGENHVIEIPKERWDNDAYYSENKDEAGKHYVRRAGFMKNHDEWDHRFFGVSESEAARIDPQQRYVLECTHMAMEDGGMTRADLKNSQTGVYIGVMNDDYKGLCRRDHFEVSNYCAVGKSTTIIASRVSYTYDLRGPCMVVDTACSSAMTAIHLGSQAIRAGECSMAICGGVSSITSPEMFIDLCKARMMSATGQCQAFCDTADGYARGEGCGIVMLKTVKKAIEDENKIWAIIRTGCNQDGHATSPITAPSGDQQEQLLKRVYTQFGVDPTSLQYVEVHGTGTPIGDPTEVNALGKFISSYRQGDSRASDIHEKTDDSQDSDGEERKRKEQVPEYNKVIKIGSVKTNIGHTESAAGTAGLIKVLLMMKHGKLVPSLHLKKDKSNLNQKIKLDEYKLDVALDVEEWAPDNNGQRISGVNSFGFGGSNSHTIVIQKKHLHTRETRVAPSVSNYVICLSAKDNTALRNTIENFGADILMTDSSLNDVAFTSVFHRDHQAYRTLVWGKNVEEITEQVKMKLKTYDQMKLKTETRLIFVFCGVGTTWHGMCSEMMKTQPVFRAKINEIDRYLEPLSGWNISDKFAKDESQYSDPFLSHVAIFCTQVALYAVWKHWGVHPEVIVGQSVGEVAAAVASGVLSLEDGVTVIYHRSKILAENTGGKMMVVGNLPVDQIQNICTRHNNRVIIGVYNSPTSCTLSGDADVMNEIQKELYKLNTEEDASILIRPLSVQCAYHSPHVESCKDAIEDCLRNISKGNRNIDHISTVTGELADNDEFHTGKYWADNVRQPVQFAQAIIKASRENVTNVFLEVGPRQVLRAHLPNIMKGTLVGECIPSMNAQKENTSMYSSLCSLYEMGYQITWNHVVPAAGCFVDIPRQVLNKSKILHIPKRTRFFLEGTDISLSTHMYVRQNGINGDNFQIQIDKETTPFVYDHSLQTTVLVPGATYVEAAFEVGHRKSKFPAHELTVSVEFVNTFTPSDDKQYLIDVAVTDMESKGFEYYAVKDGRILCRGTISKRTEPERYSVDIKAIQERYQNHMSKEESYSRLEQLDFKYGDSLSLIQQSWTSPTECIVEIAVPESIKAEAKMTFLHPSIIDAMFQTFGVLSTVGSGEGPTLPKGVGTIVINRSPQEHMFCYSQLVKTTAVGNHYNCLLLSPEGYVIAEVQDFYTKTVRISNASNQSIVYNLTWNEIECGLREKDAVMESTEVKQTKTLLVFGTNRFIKSFITIERHTNATTTSLDVSSSDAGAIFENAFSSIQNPNAIVFAVCHHVDQLIEEKKDIYDLSKNTFLTLALLIKTVREKGYSVPIFVVTENVIACKELNIQASNVCGGELWGMVRSAMSETVYPDIRLLDLSLTKENVRAFEYLVSCNATNYNEYLIRDGKMYTSELVEDAVQYDQPNHRELKTLETDTLLLKSSHPTNMVKPHFQLSQRKTITANSSPPSHMKVKLQTIALHDSSVYQTTAASAEPELTIWPEANESGFHVVALEGFGKVEKEPRKNKFMKVPDNKIPVGFCYPVNVCSTITVPIKCVFDLSCLHVYLPGMMTTCVILWNLAMLCKHSTNIVVVADDDTSLHCLLLQDIISKQGHSKTTVLRKNQLDSVQTESATSIIILAKINTVDLTRLENKVAYIQRIVSLDAFLPNLVHRWLAYNMKETHVQVCSAIDMFSVSQLTNTVPKVYKWMKCFDVKFCGQIQKTAEESRSYGRTNPLQIPRQTLSLTNGHTHMHIPLTVSKTEVFRQDCCYVIVGGLTGLGWELLQHMAQLGAGYLATFSRRLPTEDKQESISQLQDKYECRILCFQVDITDLKQLGAAMTTIQENIGTAKVKGVFHGGGVFSDKLLINMSESDAEKPLLPKIRGTWNLHLVTKNLQLDFFVMHSSIVAILGNSGQCNYAAGNSFQDSFAHYRRSLGLCGQSINWSALALGMATENKELETKLKNMGFFYLSREEIRSCFIRAVMEDKPQVTFGRFDWKLLQSYPIMTQYQYKYRSLLETHGKKMQNSDTDRKHRFDKDLYGKLDFPAQRKMIEELIKMMISETLVVDKDSLEENTRFVALGIDSMVAMSFSNCIFEATHVRIPVVMLLSEVTTVGTLASFMHDKICDAIPEERTTINDDSKKFEDFLHGSVTFMQRDFLSDYKKTPRNGELLRQSDFELTGLMLKTSDWKVILDCLLKTNPELRRLYRFSEGGQIESRLVPTEDAAIDLQEVPFDSICNEDSADCRHEHVFDLTKDLPIKFQIAIRGNTTRMRMFIHSVVGDLRSMAMLFRDVRTFLATYVRNKTLPKKDVIETLPATIVRNALAPKMSEMYHFWKQQMSEDIQPFTFAKNFEQPLEKCNRYEVKEEVPRVLVESILTHLQKDGNSLYNFVLATYFLVLHEMTGNYLVPVYTNVDMSGHVPQLASMVTRCTNAIPVIGDVRNTSTVNAFLKRTSNKLRAISEQSGFPYALIEELMPSDVLQKNIGRHRFLMHNMRNLNNTTKLNNVTVKVMNAYHKRYVYETVLYVVYDLEMKHVELEFAYNTASLGHEQALEVPRRVVKLMQTLIEHASAPLKDLIHTGQITTGNRYIKTDKMQNGAGYEQGMAATNKDGTRKMKVIKKGTFVKQTSQGCDHEVHVVMATGTCKGELLLQWGARKSQTPRTVRLDLMHEAHMKKINGLYGLVIKLPRRQILLKTASRREATDWFQALRSAFTLNHDTPTIATQHMVSEGNGQRL